MSMSDGISVKLLKIQERLLEVKFKKSGYNKYGKFPYFTLNDLVGPVKRECIKEGVVMYFPTPDENTLVLHLEDNECSDPEKSVLDISMTMPPLEQLPGQNMAQVRGSYLTYHKKYLIQDVFLICDSEDIDAYPPKGSNKKDTTVKSKRSGFVDGANYEKVSDYGSAEECLATIKRALTNEEKTISKELVVKKAIELKRSQLITSDMYTEVRRAIERDGDL